MSFSLKREIEVYINDVDSTDGVRKLAVLPELTLKVEANLFQAYKKVIGTDPEMLPHSVIDTISPIGLELVTYLKPIKDGIFVSAPEKLLFDSIGGELGYRSTQYYKPQFGKINRLIPLYIFIKTNKAIYKINTAYVAGVEISFDINYILLAKWSIQAIDLDILDTETTNFTNIIDYSNEAIYLRPKFTKSIIKNYEDGKIYEFPIIEAKIQIQNVLMPVFDKNVKVVVATPKDLIVGGRAVTGNIKCYFSSRSNHSKEFFEYVLEDTTEINRKYRLEFTLTDNGSTINFLLPYAIINLPNVEFEDVLSADIEFTSSESNYGANDDLEIKYFSSAQAYTTGYEQALIAVAPELYFKYDEASGSIINYGSLASTYPSATVTGSWTYRATGPTSPNYGTVYALAKGSFVNSDIYFAYNSVSPSSITGSGFGYYNTSSDYQHFVLNLDFVNINDIYIDIRRATTVTQATVGLHQYTVHNNVTKNIDIRYTWYYYAYSLDLVNKKFSFSINDTVFFDNATITLYANPIGQTITNIYIAGDSSGSIFSHMHYSQWVMYINRYESNLATATYLRNSFLSNNPQPAPDNGIDYSLDNAIPIGNNLNFYNAILDLDPISYFRFNDEDNTKIVNHVPPYVNSSYLTVYNSPERTNDLPPTNDLTSNSYLFTNTGGVYQYVVQSDWMTVGTGYKISASFWYKVTKKTSTSHCLMWLDGDNYFDMGLLGWYLNFDRYALSHGTTTGGCQATYSGAYIKPYVWNHVVVTQDYSGTYIVSKIYVNGVLESDYTQSGSISSRPTKFKFNIANIANRFDFEISELAFYNRLLTTNDIKFLQMGYGTKDITLQISPVKEHLVFSGNIPIVLRGNNIFPISSTINITSYNINIIKTKRIDVQCGHIVNYANNFPSISKSPYYYPITGSIQTIGYIPIPNIVKIITPIKEIIQINGYVPTRKDILGIINNTIYNRGHETRVLIGKLLQPTNTTIQVSGNIPKIYQYYIHKPIGTHIYISNYLYYPIIIRTNYDVPQIIFL